jgi:putative Holliday junction resolvase
MNIIALDIGQKRTGVAWADTGINVVLPLGVVKFSTEEKAFDELTAFLSKESFDMLVFGLPVSLDNTENDHTKRIRSFGEAVGKHFRKNVVFFDERFSSQQADRSAGGVSRDEKAAMIILESYLGSVEKNKK